ncbi:hypothetical protein EG329_008450 [Mollisiaceae sp. DMI_Dod_QoI]|nr:hypothetical protein EG329_008450 [Helotiales sp. DMI_Dod_QoI]
MASLNIFDDDRSTTPDFFCTQVPALAKMLGPAEEIMTSANIKHLVDHDLENYRQSLWSLENIGLACGLEHGLFWKPDASPYLTSSCLSSPSCSSFPTAPAEMRSDVDISVAEKSSTLSTPRPVLQRWHLHHKADRTREKIFHSPEMRINEAPSEEQMYDGYKVWYISPDQQEVHTVDLTSCFDSDLNYLEVGSHVTSVSPTCASPKAIVEKTSPTRDSKESTLTPPATPIIRSLERSLSSISSLSEDEKISEDHRRYVAQKQYYDRSGILWDTAAQQLKVSRTHGVESSTTYGIVTLMIFKPFSLHPTNLTVYEFTKLVCIQGREVFTWINSNCEYLVDRAARQWCAANALLINNADLNGLNANFMDDFLWMEPEDQVSFIKSYKRLQLEAMALREGVKLAKTELDALCMMHDDEKLAIIHQYKEDAIKKLFEQATFKDDNVHRKHSEDQEAESPKADNLYLQFLYFGLGQEKPIQDLIGINTKTVLGKTKSESKLGQEKHRSFTNMAKNNPTYVGARSSIGQEQCGFLQNVTRTAKWRLSEETELGSLSDADEDMGEIQNAHNARPKVSWDLDLSRGSSNSNLNKSEPSHSTGGTPACKVFTVSTSASDHTDDKNNVENSPPLRGQVSFNDLQCLTPSSQIDSQDCDEGSDWDFTPPRSLRKKASKILDAFKKPFTLSSRRRGRAGVKGYF